MTAWIQQLKNMAWNILNRTTVADIADILLVAFILYHLLLLTRETRASAVLKGLVLLIAATLFSGLLGLTALNWLLNIVVKNGAVVLVVLFQPELRKALEHLGSKGSLHLNRSAEQEEGESAVQEICDCLLQLSRRRVGALIVVEQSIGLKDFIETGTTLDARISSALLENIFEPNTPLHDGAVILRGNSVKAAACILTLTESQGVSRDLGTRHRAALGVTETTDAVSLIVSEETGIISMAREGRITRHLDRAALEDLLRELFCPKKQPTLRSLLKGKESRK